MVINKSRVSHSQRAIRHQKTHVAQLAAATVAARA
jgi:hypothetical protein